LNSCNAKTKSYIYSSYNTCGLNSCSKDKSLWYYNVIDDTCGLNSRTNSYGYSSTLLYRDIRYSACGLNSCFTNCYTSAFNNSSKDRRTPSTTAPSRSPPSLITYVSSADTPVALTVMFWTGIIVALLIAELADTPVTEVLTAKVPSPPRTSIPC